MSRVGEKKGTGRGEEERDGGRPGMKGEKVRGIKSVIEGGEEL